MSGDFYYQHLLDTQGRSATSLDGLKIVAYRASLAFDFFVNGDRVTGKPGDYIIRTATHYFSLRPGEWALYWSFDELNTVNAQGAVDEPFLASPEPAVDLLAIKVLDDLLDLRAQAFREGLDPIVTRIDAAITIAADHLVEEGDDGDG